MLVILGIVVVGMGAVGRLAAQPSQVDVARRYLTTPVATNAWVPFPSGIQRVFSVTAQNSSTSDQWLYLCDTNGVPANGTGAYFAPVKILAGATGGYDFGVAGWPGTNGLCIANSTTDRFLTNGSANLIISIIYNPR